MTINSDISYDFGADNSGTDWQIINDGVMGGISQSEKQLKENSMIFKGKISLENNGGFASIRTPYDDYDLSKYSKVKIRYKLKGQSAALSLSKDRRYYIPNYRLQLPKSTDWTTVSADLEQLKECYLGNPTGKFLTKDIAASIIRMGFIVANKKPGTFELEVDFLRFE